ncbi:Retrotrans gag domain-containing protein [Abeliophyllum distichum]|uniref:Retrotrans gag domain-containing protein n=1 Tax=Abeliophyllum distichum TaxID=126358 RepID=A0ABD1THY7_9LAMI
MMEMLQRMAGPPHTLEAPPAADAPPVVEIPPAVEILPSETVQTHELTPTSRHSIPVNWESILNDKVEEAIARRKSRGKPISIKEYPFTEDVMTVPLPPKFKELTGEFDGMGDPIDHNRTFQDRVRLHGWPDAIACRAFPMTLRKDAREWFDTLPPRSISFVRRILRISSRFVFLVAREKRRLTMGLMQVTKDKGESLREYMSRVNRSTLGIKNLQMSSVITALLSGLKNHGFRASLSKKPAESMTELLRRGEEYIDQEEVLKATRCDRDVYDGGNKKMRREKPSTHKHNTRSMIEYRYRPRPEVVNAISQIQLNAPLSVILREISILKELQWPERLRSDPSIRDNSLQVRVP